VFDPSGRFKGVRVIPATFDKDRLPIIDPTGRALHLINGFNRRASRSIEGFAALNFPGYEQHTEHFRSWFRSTPFGAQTALD
jgi:hypothetical protein